MSDRIVYDPDFKLTSPQDMPNQLAVHTLYDEAFKGSGIKPAFNLDRMNDQDIYHLNKSIKEVYNTRHRTGL